MRKHNKEYIRTTSVGEKKIVKSGSTFSQARVVCIFSLFKLWDTNKRNKEELRNILYRFESTARTLKTSFVEFSLFSSEKGDKIKKHLPQF